MTHPHTYNNCNAPEQKQHAFRVFRGTFKEWARVLTNGEYEGVGNNVVRQSRASVKCDWHCIYYLKVTNPDSLGNYLWARDDDNNETVSASLPIVTTRPADGKGTCMVTDVNQTNANTAGWTLAYVVPTNVGEVKRDGVVLGSLAKQEDGTWGGVMPPVGDPRVHISVPHTSGKPDFEAIDGFIFSTFRTTSTQPVGKKNEIALGFFDDVRSGP